MMVMPRSVECLGQRLGHGRVLDGQDLRRNVEQRHLRAEGIHDRCQLAAGGRAADDGQPPRQLAQVPQVAVGQGQLRAGEGQLAGVATQAEDEALGAEAVAAGRFDGVGIAEASRAAAEIRFDARIFQVLDQILLLVDGGHNLVGAVDEAGEIHLWPRADQAVGLVLRRFA